MVRQREDAADLPGRRGAQLDPAAREDVREPDLRLALPLAHPGVRHGDRLSLAPVHLQREEPPPPGHHGRRAVPRLRGTVRPLPGVRRWGDPRAAVAEPALADVVPRGAVLLAPRHALLPSTAQPLALAVAVSLLGGIWGSRPSTSAGSWVCCRSSWPAWWWRTVTWSGCAARERGGSAWPSSLPASSSPRGSSGASSTEWLYYRTSYGDLNESWISGMAIRALLLACPWPWRGGPRLGATARRGSPASGPGASSSTSSTASS